ncbi:chromosome segregation ATPase [Parasalinivibrio latis]|uniref:chromosome segregation ATPase n=1 Tax=Parasalinivibrio latis TaxID=2952610 RepID=UPI0030DDF3D3
MVRIQGLPAQVNRPSLNKKKSPNTDDAQSAPQPSEVAAAVARGIRNPEMAGEAHAQVHYDLPDGKSRQALSEYLSVMNQQKRDELIAMFGVDIFV